MIKWLDTYNSETGLKHNNSTPLNRYYTLYNFGFVEIQDYFANYCFTIS